MDDVNMSGKPLTIGVDRAAGILFLAIGASGLWLGRDLPIGSLVQIGSGFLPRLIFGGISLIGGLKLLLSFRPNGETTTVELPRSLVLITLSFVTFGLLIERLGLVVAIAGMLVAVEFAGNHKRSIKVFLLLLIGLAAFSIAVFRYLLGIPLEVWPKWT